MSVRMNATLYSDVARIERGDYLTFHCEQLSQDARDNQRYFFGCYYPRWHAFYMEEVRSIIGNMGYSELRHFPAYPLDVYTKTVGPEGQTMSTTTVKKGKTTTVRSGAGVAADGSYTTDDFQVDHVLVIAHPQNQRDDDIKRFKIVSVNTEHLKTELKRLPPLSSSSLAHPDTMLSTLQAPGGHRVPVKVSNTVRSLLKELREAYIDHAGGGIPEVGLKAMGRPFRRVSVDGRRWATLEQMQQLVRDSRAFGAPASSFHETHSAQRTIRAVAETIYDAFPKEEQQVQLDVPGEPARDVGVDYDVLMDYLRGHMNAVRKKAVWEVFERMDYDKDGNITILDIQSCFNAQEHPVVVHDRIFSAEKLLRGFLAVWDENNSMYGLVPYTEFMDYYNGLSAIIEDDAVFLGILKTTWKLPNWPLRSF